MSATRDTGFLRNVIQVHDTGVRIMSGSEMLMAISSSGQVTITGELSGSDAANALLLDGTGSLAFTTTSSFLVVSASQQQISSSLLQVSASYISLSASYTTFSGSASTRISNNETASNSLTNASASFSTRITSDSSSLSSRTTQVEKTYATTGSNTYTGTQNFSSTCTPNGFNSGASINTAGGLQVTNDAYFSSSVFIKGNVTVYGTQSVAYISSSQLNIGTNTITVNTFTPSVRFGGLSVFDSGSTGLTGSIFWDSELNRWIYVNASGSGGGATYGGGMFISGPRNTQGMGCEQGTTACMLLVGQGGDHLTSSMIYHSSTVTCVPNTLIGSTICTTMANASCIGIGTTTPTHPLEIYAATGNQLKISTNDATSANNSGIFFYNEASATSSTRRSYILLDPNGANGSGGDYSYFDMYGSGTTRLMNQLASGLLALGVGGTNIINITGSSVGIGTSSPTSKLEVIGSTSNVNGYSDGSIQVTGTNPIAFVGPSNLNPSLNRWGFVLREVTDGDFSIRNYRESSTPLMIKNSGNVGIGTTTPYQKLVNTGHIALTTATAGTDATADVQRAAIGWQATASDTVLGSFITAANQGNWGSDMQFYTRPSTGGNAVLRLTIANSGAATFCSCVTATQFNVSTSGGATQIYNTGGGHTVITNATANKDINYQTSGTGGHYLNTAGVDRLIISSTGTAQFNSEDISGNRTTLNDVLTITQINGNAPYNGFGSGILFRGTTYNGGGSGISATRSWGRIGMQVTDSSFGTTGENMIFQVAAADNSDTLTTALTLAYNSAATFSSSVTAASLLSSTWVGAQGVRISSAPSVQGVYLGNSGTTCGDFATIEMVGGVCGGSEIDFTSPSLDYTGRIGYNNPSKYMWFVTNSNERMRIFSCGQVAINRTDSGAGALGVRGLGSTDAANAFYVDNSSCAELFSVRNDGIIRTGTIAGSPYNNTSAQVPNLYVSSGGTLERGTSSSMRYKENIIDWEGSGINTILALKPKTFKYKKDYYHKADIDFLGLIAEEVAEVSPYLADYENEDRTGQVENVRYANIVTPLIKAVQEQQCTICSQAAMINTLKTCLGIA